MNLNSIKAIYNFEMSRMRRTLGQSLFAPVISTVLYFIVFGSAIGSRISDIDGVSYGAFIVPGLIILTILTESTANASFGIYLPRFTGTIYEVLSAPISFIEILIGYVGAAATKSIIVGFVILFTAHFFVSIDIQHPIYMVLILFLISISFSLFGFIIGIWADSFEKLQVIPLLIITPLTFLGGSFYSIKMLPEAWQTLSLLNPIVYLISGFRWSFYGQGDVSIFWSLTMTFVFLTVCICVVSYIFKTGYKLKQ
ncbi:MAG: ABC transporter permease [Bdellovibrionales bacterium]|nr:ABC transporter permease [Bdellovibrionales bacterium]